MAYGIFEIVFRVSCWLSPAEPTQLGSCDDLYLYKEYFGTLASTQNSLTHSLSLGNHVSKRLTWSLGVSPEQRAADEAEQVAPPGLLQHPFLVSCSPMAKAEDTLRHRYPSDVRITMSSKQQSLLAGSTSLGTSTRRSKTIDVAAMVVISFPS